MMLEATLANESKEFLQARDPHHAGAAEGVQRVVGELAFAYVSVDGSVAVVGGKTREAHGARLHQAHTRPISVLAPHGPGDNLLEIHLHFAEEMLGQIAAMETDRIVWVFAVL